jgi:hypothetical protein
MLSSDITFWSFFRAKKRAFYIHQSIVEAIRERISANRGLTTPADDVSALSA